MEHLFFIILYLGVFKTLQLRSLTRFWIRLYCAPTSQSYSHRMNCSNIKCYESWRETYPESFVNVFDPVNFSISLFLLSVVYRKALCLRVSFGFGSFSGIAEIFETYVIIKSLRIFKKKQGCYSLKIEEWYILRF